MKKFITAFGAAGLAAALMAGTVVPASAASFGSSDIVTVQYGRDGYGDHRRYDRDDRQYDRRDRRDNGRRDLFERRGDYHYYNGHRGYRERHRGYRYYNGFWFPPAAFSFGFGTGFGFGYHR